jgi:uncharacterized protein YndB with AHSA1/START domain
MFRNSFAFKIAFLVGVLWSQRAVAQDSQVFAVDLKTTIAAEPAKVWDAITDLQHWEKFFPAIERTEMHRNDGLEGRTLYLKGGAFITEVVQSTRQLDTTRIMSYRITDTSLPFTAYESRIFVEPAGKGSTLRWVCTAIPKGATPAEAKKGVEGFYNGCFAGLKKLLETDSAAAPRSTPNEPPLIDTPRTPALTGES